MGVTDGNIVSCCINTVFTFNIELVVGNVVVVFGDATVTFGDGGLTTGRGTGFL